VALCDTAWATTGEQCAIGAIPSICHGYFPYYEPIGCADEWRAYTQCLVDAQGDCMRAEACLASNDAFELCAQQFQDRTSCVRVTPNQAACPANRPFSFYCSGAPPTNCVSLPDSNEECCSAFGQ
jgi:hypothetical protein